MRDRFEGPNIGPVLKGLINDQFKGTITVTVRGGPRGYNISEAQCIDFSQSEIGDNGLIKLRTTMQGIGSPIISYWAEDSSLIPAGGDPIIQIQIGF